MQNESLWRKLLCHSYGQVRKIERRNSMRTEQELKDELGLLERKLAGEEIMKYQKERSIKELKLRIEVIKWTLKGEIV